MELVREVSDSVCVLEKPEGGENTHSVFEVFFCASVHFKAKPSKVVGKEGDAFSMLFLDSKKNAPLST